MAEQLTHTFYKVHPYLYRFLKIYSLMIFIFTDLYSHHHHLILEHFYHPSKKPCTISSHSPFILPAPDEYQSPSISMDLPTLGITYKYLVSWLASFVSHIFKVYPYWSYIRSSLFFRGLSDIPLYISSILFIHPLTLVGWHFKLFPFWLLRVILYCLQSITVKHPCI